MNASSGLISLLWFLAILAVIPVALWLLKRTPMGGAGMGGLLRVVSSLPLSTNQRILIVEVGQGEARQWLVLGATPQGITTLHTPPPQAEPPSGAALSPFAQLLGRKLAGKTDGVPMRAKWFGLGVLLVAGSAWAQTSGNTPPATLPLMIGQGPGGNSYSVPIQTLLFFTALGFLPAVLLMMTAFTRIAIVLSLMRQALGTQSAPPNQVIIGLSLFLTFFVMSPTLDKVYADAWQPYSAGQIQFDEALKRAEVPMRGWMLKQTRQSDVALFARLAKLEPGIKAEQVPFKVLVPAFVTSELKSAFQIAFLIFIPFLVIDMIVASVLMSLGMMMLSPVLVALPFKLMLFVLADGWNLLLGSLAASFAT